MAKLFGPLPVKVLFDPNDQTMYASKSDVEQYNPEEEGVYPGSVSESMFDALSKHDCRIEDAIDQLRDESAGKFNLNKHIWCPQLGYGFKLRIAKGPMDVKFIRLREKSKPYWTNDKNLTKAVTELESYIKKLAAKARDKKEYDRKAAVVMQWVDHHFKDKEGYQEVKDYFVELTKAKKSEWGQNIPERGFHASLDKRLETVAHALNVLADSKIAAGGYTDCACRDCFDVAIADEDGEAALCNECEDAGCSADSDEECQREDAYGG